MTGSHPLTLAARDILASNWTGEFTKPAPSLYPHQWNWDSGFIALGYATYDPGKAMQELRSLFKGQWTNGLLPHIVFRPDPHARYFPGPDFWQSARSPFAPAQLQTSGITQPPVHAMVLKDLANRYPDDPAVREFLQEMYPKVLALHRYLYTHRDPKGEGLVVIRHPWEPGTDNSPTWDRALERMAVDKQKLPSYQRQDLQSPEARAHRPTDEDYDRYVYLVDLFRSCNYDEAFIQKHCPFQIQDPLFNSILAHANECLMVVAELFSLDASELKAWNQKTLQALNDKLWSEERGLYDAWDLWSDTRIPMHSHSGFAPLLAGAPSAAQAKKMVERMEGPSFSGTARRPAWLLPSYDLLGPDFNPQKYWRGPIWLNINYLISKGLGMYGYIQLEAKIREHTLELVQRYGFFEYFHPYQEAQAHAGFGTDRFSWTAAMLNMD